MNPSDDIKKFKIGYVAWDDGRIEACCFCDHPSDKRYVNMFDGEEVWTIRKHYVYEKYPDRIEILKEQIKDLKEDIDSQVKIVEAFEKEEEGARNNLERIIKTKAMTEETLKKAREHLERFKKALEEKRGGKKKEEEEE